MAQQQQQLANQQLMKSLLLEYCNKIQCKSLSVSLFSTIGQTLGRRTKNMYITNKRKLICSGDISRVQKDTHTNQKMFRDPDRKDSSIRENSENNYRFNK